MGLKISTLLSLLDEIDKFDLAKSQDAANATMGWVLPTITNFPDIADLVYHDIDTTYKLVHDSINKFDQSVVQAKQTIKEKIRELESQYFVKSDELYDEGVRTHENPSAVLDRRFSLSPDIEKILSDRIGIRADWRWPGAIIRPGLEVWIEKLVALDPLYLLDESRVLLDFSLQQRFNQQYKSRLRKIILNANKTKRLLEELPDNQFGYFLVYNFFNYRPLHVIQQYLKEIYVKLKPGGSVGFTINNCDRPGGADLSERNYASYTPGHAVIDSAQESGFELTYQLDINAAVTWFELKRPGVLTTLRGGQPLAKIVACG